MYTARGANWAARGRPVSRRRDVYITELPNGPPAAAIADNTNQKEEQTMFVNEYLMKAIQDDARRARERDRLLREVRQARRARRQRLVPAAPARHQTQIGNIVVSENITLDGVIQDRPVTKASGPAAGSRCSGSASSSGLV
jgi:hypothetical protein